MTDNWLKSVENERLGIENENPDVTGFCTFHYILFLNKYFRSHIGGGPSRSQDI
jgi:hypothetical protein